MHTRVVLALACVLIVGRVPSLAQPMGADQGLYAYVGERILVGEIPYRHAWDQKPPAALLYLLLSDPSFQRLAGVNARAQCDPHCRGGDGGLPARSRQT